MQSFTQRKDAKAIAIYRNTVTGEYIHVLITERDDKHSLTTGMLQDGWVHVPADKLRTADYAEWRKHESLRARMLQRERASERGWSTRASFLRG